MEQLINALSALSLIQWIIVSAVWLMTNALLLIAFVWWFFRRQWKFYKNLKRPVLIFPPIGENNIPIAGGEMKNELKLLKDNGFLNVKDESGNFKSFNPVGKHCVVVIGYKPGMLGLADILRRIQSNHVPLIVYTYGSNAINGNDKKLIDEYPYSLLANFPLTLLNHIFATVSSFPYDA